jgi:lipoprotein NlpD
MTLRIAAFSAYLMAALAMGCATTQRAPVVDRSGGAAGPARPSQPAAKQPTAPAGTGATSSTAPAGTGAAASNTAPKPPSDVVVARAPPAWDPNDPRPDFHTVLRGETLFGIALAYGLTYREIAEWNSLTEPYVIRVGQQLRLRSAQNNVTVLPAKPTSVDSTTIITDQTQEAGTLGGGESAAPVPPPAVPVPAPAQAPQSAAAPKTVLIKSEPKALKLPYTEANWARFETEVPPAPAAKVANAAAPVIDRSVDAPAEKPVETLALPKAESSAKPEGAPGPIALAAPSVVVEGVEWAWPAPSKVASNFSDASKGIALAGAAGQSVLASAAGQVSYVGNSLRGYGKMIVIKHNKMFLSVYAHNSKVFVKEGQNVGKGQKIAEMGNTDSEGVVLHFEIRRYGKPVDPLKYLPNGASS